MQEWQVYHFHFKQMGGISESFSSNYVLDDINGRGITLENIWKTHKQ
jgi:hypothetical protein